MFRLRFSCMAAIFVFTTTVGLPRGVLAVGGEGILVPLENWTVLSDIPPAKQPAAKQPAPIGANEVPLAKLPPAVLLVPGMLAGDDTMSAIRLSLRSAKIPVAMFRYDSQLGVDRIATRLASVLAAEAERLPNRDLVLVTHSMGGVVARCVVESPECQIKNVSDLIMIAPPNGGSSLAALSGTDLQDLLQTFQAVELKAILNEDSFGLLDNTLNLFLGNAKKDLAPGSELLVRLNAGQRNPAIKYSILAGTKGPIPPLARGFGQLLIGRMIAQNPEAAPGLRKVLAVADRDEWIQGLGDGVVSVKSTQLSGVADHITLPFAHRDPSESLDNPATRQLVDEVMARTNSDKNL